LSDIADDNYRRWGILIWWIIAHLVGGFGGEIARSAIRFFWGNPLYDELPPLQYWAIPFAAIAFCLGLTQRAVLRKYLGVSAWWVFATMISRGVLFPLGSSAFETVLNLPYELFLFSEGLIVGIAQWLVLRMYVAPASRWVWVNTIGVPLSIFIVIGYLMPIFGDANPFIFIWNPLTLTVQGICTGLVLVGLVRDATPIVSDVDLPKGSF
jgi:hypothetical protein